MRQNARMSIIRQLIAGLSFFGLLLFGAPTISGTIGYIEAWSKGSEIEIAGFVPRGVVPTAAFAVVFILSMHGYWSSLFRRRMKKEEANQALDATSETAPGADSSSHQG